MNWLLTALVSPLAFILAGAAIFVVGFYLAFGWPVALMVLGLLIAAFGFFNQ